MTLNEITQKVTPSDRLVICNAARQVIYRGYAANVENAGILGSRKVKRFGLGMETYRATEKLWDWQNMDKLPPQVPIEQFSQYQTGELNHILYIKIELENEFGEVCS